MSVRAITAKRLAVLLCCALVLASDCPEGPAGETQAAIIASLVIDPDNFELTVGTSVEMTATATFEDGSDQIVNADASWESLNETIVEVTQSGLATALAAGAATIEVSYGGLTATSVGTVKPPASSVGARILAGTSSGVAHYFTDGSSVTHVETVDPGFGATGALLWDEAKQFLFSFSDIGDAELRVLTLDETSGELTPTGNVVDLGGQTVGSAGLWAEGATLGVALLQPPSLAFFNYSGDGSVTPATGPVDGQGFNAVAVGALSLSQTVGLWLALRLGSPREIWGWTQEEGEGFTEVTGSADPLRTLASRMAFDPDRDTQCMYIFGPFDDTDAATVGDDGAIGWAADFPIPVAAVAGVIVNAFIGGLSQLALAREDVPQVELHRIDATDCELTVLEAVLPVGFDFILDVAESDEGRVIAVTGYNQGEPTDYMQVFYHDGSQYQSLGGPLELNAVALGGLAVIEVALP